MHYKNGREAKNGDKVMLLPSYGPPVVGILYDATVGNDYCNGKIAITHQNDPCPNLKECLHLDDVLAALPAEVPDSSIPTIDPQVVAEATDGSPARTDDEPHPLGTPIHDTNGPAVDQFKIGEKVTFSPESGNDTTEVYTIDGGERGEGQDAQWFWRLVEKPGSLFLGSNLQATAIIDAE